MKVAVGSTNPVKIDAVRAAFHEVWPKQKWEVIDLETPSRVSSQPKSDQESIKGATNRAKDALKKSKADYGVGIEGGLSHINKVWFDTAWIVVIDKKGNEGIGSTVNMQTPPKFIKKSIDEGLEIGQIDDEYFKVKNSKQGIGHFGLMTNGNLTRKDGYIQGVIAALTRFIHPELY